MWFFDYLIATLIQKCIVDEDFNVFIHNKYIINLWSALTLTQSIYLSNTEYY